MINLHLKETLPIETGRDEAHKQPKLFIVHQNNQPPKRMVTGIDLSTLLSSQTSTAFTAKLLSKLPR